MELTVAASESVGVRLLVVNALHERAAAFYRQFGFEPSPTNPLDLMITVVELTEPFLGVPVATIYRWRHLRRGPVGYRIGRHVRYRTRDIERWLEAQRDAHEQQANGS